MTNLDNYSMITISNKMHDVLSCDTYFSGNAIELAVLNRYCIVANPTSQLSTFRYFSVVKDVEMVYVSPSD